MDSTLFAHCSPFHSDFSISEREREEVIRKCLKKIHWVRPDMQQGILKDSPIRVEAVIILRRPPPWFSKVPKKTFIGTVSSFIEKLFSKPKPDGYEDSFLGFAHAYAWSIFKVPKIELLSTPNTIRQAAALGKEGFHVQVLTLKVKKRELRKGLHRAATEKEFYIVSKSFDEFLRSQ